MLFGKHIFVSLPCQSAVKVSLWAPKKLHMAVLCQPAEPQEANHSLSYWVTVATI